MRSFTHWYQELSTEETNEVLLQLASVHARRIASSTTRTMVERLIETKDLLGLCGLELDYESVSVHDAIQVRQISAFFQKRADLDFGIDKRRVAFVKFLESERSCAEVNDAFQLERLGRFSFLPSVSCEIVRIRRKIALILGSIPDIGAFKLRFGPGATTQVPKRTASAKRKLSQVLACSEDLVDLAKQVLEEMPAWIPFGDSDTARVPVELHHGRLDFVPKSYKTDRCIVVEPMLNQMVQLGIGDYIARRLRRAGIDLSDQSRNQSLAREGSITGALATLDLSSASDSIATELVYQLLPVDWAILLDRARTSKIEVPTPSGGKALLRQEKFSSMGNGFTFALESLLFYAIACAAVPEDQHNKVSVYGDDIIVPSAYAVKVANLLKFLGFAVNQSKSFWTGPFRESCGVDYLSGINIRPSYVKGVLTPLDVYRLHNFYRKWYDEEACSLLLSLLDSPLRKWGPEGYGDGHLHGDYPKEPYKRHLGWSGHVFETFSYKPRKDFECLPGDHVFPAYSVYVRSDWTPPGVHEEDRVPRSGDLKPHGTERGVLPAYSYDKRGRLGVDIPGRGKVRLLKVYILA